MSSLPLKEKVYPYFAQVLESQSYVKTEDYRDDKHMGDEVMSFESKHLIIRFYTDRGDLYSVIGAPPGEKWHGLGRFFQFMGLLNEQQYQQSTPEQLGRLFTEHYSQVESFFEDYPKRSSELIQWEDKLRKEMVKRFNETGKLF